MSPKVIVFPAYRHENDTDGRCGIKRPLALEEVDGLVCDDVFRKLTLHYSSEKIPFRAITRGKDGHNYNKKWETIQSGDIAILIHDNVCDVATIFLKEISESLADKIFEGRRDRQNDLPWNLWCMFEPRVHRGAFTEQAFKDAADRKTFNKFGVISAPDRVERIQALIGRR
jgi:hypothetical protein